MLAAGTRLAAAVMLVDAITTTLDVPPTLTVTLALAAPMFTLDVPLLMLATLVITPVKHAPLPRI